METILSIQHPKNPSPDRLWGIEIITEIQSIKFGLSKRPDQPDNFFDYGMFTRSNPNMFIGKQLRGVACDCFSQIHARSLFEEMELPYFNRVVVLAVYTTAGNIQFVAYHARADSSSATLSCHLESNQVLSCYQI